MLFKATEEVVRLTRSGNSWEVTGSLEEVIGKATLEARDSDASLVPMAADILADQMRHMQVEDKLMFNWACSVMNIKVERIA